MEQERKKGIFSITLEGESLVEEDCSTLSVLYDLKYFKDVYIGCGLQVRRSLDGILM